VVLTSHGADRSAITMATLREQLALKRQQLDDEKRLLADSQAQEQKLAAEKTAYLEYEERLRQELAGLENELLDVRSEMTTSKANVEQLVQERTAWDPEYLAQLESVNLPPGRQSSAVSKALTVSSASGPATPAVNRPVPASSVNDTSSRDASSTVPRPDSGFPSFVGSFGPPVGSNTVQANPATDIHSDPNQDFFGNAFDDYYGDSGHDDNYFQNGSVNDNDDSGIGLDESLSGEASIDTRGNSDIATPAFGAPLQARTWDPKYLAASANAADFVLPMPSGLVRDANGRIIRDRTRSDQLFDYRLSERRHLYECGWNPDTLDNNVFPPHSDEAHLMEAIAAIKDEVLENVDRHKDLASATYGDCCPQVLTGLPRHKKVQYRCPHAGCQGKSTQWNIAYYRVAALCRLERSEYWKISLPLTPSTTSGQTAFHASAECCVYQGHNHCVVHVHMETKSYNDKVRKPHHNGRQSCHCPIPCIGDSVTQCWTEQDYQLLDALSGWKPPAQRPGPKPPAKPPGPKPQVPKPPSPTGSVCQSDGCKNMAKATNGQSVYCGKHARACKTEECNGRCRGDHAYCDKCNSSKIVCQYDGCKNRFMATNEQPSYCRSHERVCMTEACERRINRQLYYCPPCYDVNREKRKRKNESNVVGEDDGGGSPKRVHV
jgi:hypothetical protein